MQIERWYLVIDGVNRDTTLKPAPLMKQIAPLTETEQVTLTEAHHNHPTFRVRQRAQALLLNHRGYSMTRIHGLFEVQHETVSRWLQRWQSEGLTGLLDRGRSGRPPILDDTDVGVLLEAIDRNPHLIKVARDGLFEKTGKPVSRDTVKRTLKKRLCLQALPPVLPTQTGRGAIQAGQGSDGMVTAAGRSGADSFTPLR